MRKNNEGEGLIEDPHKFWIVYGFSTLGWNIFRGYSVYVNNSHMRWL